MANQKPNTFSLKNTVDGSEEVYTQTGGVHEKFTLAQMREYILQGVDVWSYVELTLTPADLAQIETVKFQLLDEALLGIDEYYEINRIICESIIDSDNNIANSIINVVQIRFKTNAGINYALPYPDNSAVADIPDELIGCSIPLVFCFYPKQVGRKQFRPNMGLYLDSVANGGGGTVQYLIKIHYKIRTHGN